MRILLFNFILISLFSAHNGYAQMDKDVLKVQQILQRQSQDWNKGDIDAFMNGYWESPNLQFIGSKGVTKGYKSTLGEV